MTDNDKSQSPRLRRRGVWVALGLALLALGIGASLSAKRLAGTSRDTCRDESDPEACLEDLAARLGDVRLCEGVQQHNHCLKGVALHGTSGQVCEQIQDATARSRCAEELVELGGDPALCQLSEPNRLGDCYALAARQRGPEVCRSAPADARGPCLAAVASEIEDLGAACEGSSACRAHLGAIDLAVCDGIPADEADTLASCFAPLEKREGWVPDASCRRFTQPAARDACFSQLARARGHGSSCALVEDAARRQQCLSKAAMADPAQCRQLTDPAAQRHCFFAASYDLPDGSICQGLDGIPGEVCVKRTRARLIKELARAQ